MPSLKNTSCSNKPNIIHFWVCLHWYLWAIWTKLWRQCSIWMEEKSQGKSALFIFFHRLCVHLKDTQIEVTTCAKESRVEKYMDKLTLKITLRAMPKWYFTSTIKSLICIRTVPWGNCLMIQWFLISKQFP